MDVSESVSKTIEKFDSSSSTASELLSNISKTELNSIIDYCLNNIDANKNYWRLLYECYLKRYSFEDFRSII